MDKNLKKCYTILDLPFNSTEDEVELRKRAMIKILESEPSVKNEQKIIEIKDASSKICENIKNNGIPKNSGFRFECSNESIISLIIVMLFISFFCYCTIYYL